MRSWGSGRSPAGEARAVRAVICSDTEFEKISLLTGSAEDTQVEVPGGASHAAPAMGQRRPAASSWNVAEPASAPAGASAAGRSAPAAEASTMRTATAW
jgi:hypothetical protein